MAMKKYWKRLEELGTALKLRPFRNARLKLTALYAMNTIVVLSVFLAILSYVRIWVLRDNLAGKLAPGFDLDTLVRGISLDLQISAAILAGFVLLAICVLSYFFVNITLRPIREFVEAQRRFISDASHELRTPLATVKTENEVALLDPDRVTREEAISLLQSNVEEVNRIATILNNLLNLASFNSATGAPPFSAVDLAAVARLVQDRLKLLAGRKEIRIAADLRQTWVWGNATALEEIISNLLKNAVQYTPAGGQVSIEVRSDPKEKKGVLVVRDTGVGIAPQDLPHIFEPFYRSDKSLHMHQQGNGLGLPLVREIAKRHRGLIDIQSEIGKGTIVTILIPLAPAAKIGSDKK
jgi:signal transduction histidine kinase